MTAHNSTAAASHALLRELIDDASLFPPERADMGTAVARHLAQRHSDVGWLQGRFLCPASRLDELVDRLPQPCPEWPTTAILDAPTAATDTEDWGERVRENLSRCHRLSERTRGRARVESVELALPDDHSADVAECANSLAQALKAVPEVGAAFLEIPRDRDWAKRIPAVVEVLAARRTELIDRGMTAAGAKLRCGGIVAEAFPSVEEVATFLRACVVRDLPFKCTAGLHHPSPTPDPATGARMHGFLGVIGAGLLLRAGAIDDDEVAEVIAESDPDHVTLDASGLAWRDRRIDADAIIAGRREMVVGFGSCSLAEPVADLVGLGILQPTAATCAAG